jgi:hypothetical protein
LRPFTRLWPSNPANSAAFGRLHRLAIHDDNRRTLRPTRLRSCLFIERCLNGAPDARVLPRREVVIDGAPHWKLSGNQAPLASSPQQVKDGVEDRAKIRCASSSTCRCGRQQASNKRPGGVRQVCGIEFVRHPPVSGIPHDSMRLNFENNFSNIL